VTILNSWKAVATACVVLCLTSISFAQQAASSSIRGWIADPSGAAVQKAGVALVDSDRGVSIETLSDGQGRFNFPDLAPGAYELRVKANGFAEASQQVSVSVGRNLDVPFRLKVNADNSKIDVTSIAAGIDTTS